MHLFWHAAAAARPRLALAPAAAAAIVIAVAGGCGDRTITSPGRGGVIDRPIALLSASSNDVTSTELYFVSENGGTSVEVPTFSGPKWEVRWSGDGRHLAIAGTTLGVTSSQVTLASDVWVLNADGTGLQQITHDGISGSVSWLPDGRLAFVSVPASGVPQWFAVPAAGGTPVPLPLRNGQPVFTPDWARVGSRMTFTENATVYTAAVDGTSERALASGVLPRWSPTGDRLAFMTRLGDTPTLVVVPVDDASHVTRVADLSDLTDAPSGIAWSPDGSRLAWVRPTAAAVQAVVAPAGGSSLPMPLVQRSVGVVAYDVDVDWRPTAATSPASATGAPR